LIKEVFHNLKTVKNLVNEFGLWWTQIQEVLENCYFADTIESNKFDYDLGDWDYGMRFLTE